MAQVQLVVALIMIGLFTYGIVAFAMNFAVDNEAKLSVADDAEMSSLYTSTRTSLDGFSTDSESQYQSIIETTLEPGSDAPQSVGPFAITPLNAIDVVKNILQVGYTKIFGTGTGFGVFLTAIISIIVFLLGLFLYKTLRGLPD
jgi:hypothetical protein